MVEWNNVSGGGDGSPDWTMLHREYLRRGRGLGGRDGTQKVGVDGGGFVEGMHLKKLAGQRYASLDHPGDAFTHIFSQVGRALRESDPSSPLGSTAVQRLLAVGESQSAGCLVTYINALDGLAVGIRRVPRAQPWAGAGATEVGDPPRTRR